MCVQSFTKVSLQVSYKIRGVMCHETHLILVSTLGCTHHDNHAPACLNSILRVSYCIHCSFPKSHNVTLQHVPSRSCNIFFSKWGIVTGWSRHYPGELASRSKPLQGSLWFSTNRKRGLLSLAKMSDGLD